MMFSTKVAIVTGGSSGIGRAAALALARQGAKVLITGRRPENLKETAALHKDITGVVADVAVPGDAPDTIAKAIDSWGRLDILINNAGAGALLPLRDATAERIKSILAVNVVGPSLLAAAALPYLGATKGSIVIIQHVRSQAGRWPLALCCQQGGAGAPDALLGAGTGATGHKGQRRRGRPDRIGCAHRYDGPLSETCCGDRGGGARTDTAQATRHSG